MSGWKLDPDGIQSVLHAVNAEAERLQADLLGTQSAPVDHASTVITGLMWAPEVTGPVLEAVNAAMGTQVENISAVVRGITAAQLGVLNATVAYNQHNEEMAAQAQAAAVRAAQGNLSWFENHGVQ